MDRGHRSNVFEGLGDFLRLERVELCLQESHGLSGCWCCAHKRVASQC